MKSVVTPAKLPKLSELEAYLLAQMNTYYGVSEKVYSEYEELVEKSSKNP